MQNKNETKTMKYFLYCRKSTDEKDRQILSLDSQETEALKRFGDLEIIKLPQESVSAFEPYKRPVFADMISRLNKGEAQGIIAWHPDRLSRNPIDAAQIIYLLDIGVIKDLKFCSYYFDNSPEGKMMLQIVLSQSKYSSDKLSKDVKRGIDKKAAMGWRPGLVPLGYLNSKTKEKGEQDISSDPQLFDLVRKTFRIMLTGNYTVPELWKVVTDELGLRMPATKNRPMRKLHVSELYRILIIPFYYGWYEWPAGSGNWFQGKHEPMITETEYRHIQFLLGREGRPRKQKHDFPFTGIMRCGECGGAITAEERFKKQKNGNVHHYIYYRCTKKMGKQCTQRQVEVKSFIKQVDEILQGLVISDDFKNWALKYLHEVRKGEAGVNEAAFASKQKALLKVTHDLDNLVLRFTASENANEDVLTLAEYQTLKAKLAKEKSALETQVNEQSKTIDDWVELTERTFNFVRYARIWFAKGDFETKRAIFASLGSHHLMMMQEALITLHKPLEAIKTKRVLAEREIKRLAPRKTLVKYSNVEDLRRKIPVLSGIRESDSRLLLGKQAYCHCTNPAGKQRK